MAKESSCRDPKRANRLAARVGHVGALLAIRRGKANREFLLSGDLDRFQEFANADLELCRSADMPWISQSYAWLGLAHFWRGRWEEAAKLYPLVVEAMVGGALLRWWFGPIETVAGMAAAAGRQWEKAEEHFRTTLRQAHELPHMIEQPEIRRWYARMLLDRDSPGDRDKARELLTEAVAMYREIGMPKHVEMAEALLGEV
jgi:tetratricopeptide (TPR) repeat protein